MRISIELTPRDSDSLVCDLRAIREKLPAADTINIPDLLRFSVRSWEGCGIARAFFGRAVPHIRAMDVDPHAPLAMLACLRKHGIKEVLVVSGDKPQEMSHKVYPTRNLDIIAKFKHEAPDLTIYATLDPYRQSVSGERDLLRAKRDAGADGFFTQPVFDLRLMEIYAELAEPERIFWGASPVLSERSMNYWETKNRVVFPSGFEPTMEWNRRQAAKVFAKAKELGSSVYFMPIKTNVCEYLEGVI